MTGDLFGRAKQNTAPAARLMDFVCVRIEGQDTARAHAVEIAGRRLFLPKKHCTLIQSKAFGSVARVPAWIAHREGLI